MRGYSILVYARCERTRIHHKRAMITSRSTAKATTHVIDNKDTCRRMCLVDWQSCNETDGPSAQSNRPTRLTDRFAIQLHSRTELNNYSLYSQWHIDLQRLNITEQGCVSRWRNNRESPINHRAVPWTAKSQFRTPSTSSCRGRWNKSPQTTATTCHVRRKYSLLLIAFS